MTKQPTSMNGSSTFISIVSIAAGCLAAIIAGSFLSFFQFSFQFLSVLLVYY
ncbi:hypothetical protein [Guptibacillus spartinae]|uniref:hypothetical protein n=1 Tax=Guptibacillus spartinae TaxID=3025679 RepID=UPI00235ED736|nr:hypothetical protein [Pseudalkalibacillus spartinae]